MDDIIVSLERVSRLMRQAQYADGLNPAQWEALRYLSRCNRLSNSPLALAQYLGATKGTISQTVTALRRKGLIERTARAGNARSIELTLTPLGVERLRSDPWLGLRETIEALPGKVRRRMTQGLEALRDDEIRRRRAPAFGVCLRCRFHREADASRSARCMLIDAPLTAAETDQLCVEFVAG
jgi:DNA-binding MarR family transcriptional regulator